MSIFAKAHQLNIVFGRHFFDFKYRYGRPILGRLFLFLSRANSLCGQKTRAIKYALTAHRYHPSESSFECAKDQLTKNSYGLMPLIPDDISLREASRRSIVICWPLIDRGQLISKGILIIKFTRVSAYYFYHTDIAALTKYFFIVLEPSWSGYMDEHILFWARTKPELIFVQSSELSDRVAISGLFNNLIPISIGASDWVDHKAFSPTEKEKDYDSVYVANTSPIKRVHIYLRALRKIAKSHNPNYKGVLVCAEWGGKSNEIAQLIDFYGVQKQCELRFSLNKDELSDLLSRSKVNILLSLKEGSNKSLFESMLCNVPVIALAENIGINKNYINEYTGLLVYESQLSNALIAMRNDWKGYQPREWAMRNISPQATTQKLVQVIAHRSLGKNTYAHDLLDRTFIKTNNPEVSYLDYPLIDSQVFSARILSIFAREAECDPGRELAICTQDFMAQVSSYSLNVEAL